MNANEPQESTQPKEIPEPPDHSADGTQKKETSENSIVEVLTPIDKKLGTAVFQDAIDLLSQKYPRNLGGEIGSVLIAAATRHLTFQLQETKSELREVRANADSLREQVSQKDILIARQDEKLTALSQGRHFRYLLVTLGTALVGLGLELILKEMVGFGLSCILIGLVIIAGTWFLIPKRD